MNRRDQVIWASGFIDREGCIAISRDKVSKARGITTTYSMRIRLSVGQRVDTPLIVLQDLFGGSLTKEKSRDMWAWVAQNRVAGAALEEMEPYLIVKADQARVAIEFQSRRKVGGGSRSWEDHERDEMDYYRISAMKKPWNVVPDLYVELKVKK